MKALVTVWKKELLELVRDRRTLMLTLLFAPLFGPMLYMGMVSLDQSKTEEQLEKPLSIAIAGADRAPNLVGWLASQGIVRKEVADPDAAIRAQEEDVYLRIGDDFSSSWREGKPALVEVVHDSTRRDSQIPVKRLEGLLQRYNQQVGALRLLARGINPGVVAPMAVSRKDLSTPEARSAGLAAMLLPYLLIFGAFMGSMALVIDTTAGERERQSLEPLLATPARRASILSGKIAAACTAGLVSLVLTLLVFRAGGALVPAARQLAVGFNAMALMMLVLTPTVFLGAALLTFIAAAAKSVKEAQSYTTVLILLPMIPTIVLMVSPVKNQLWMFAVPFLAQNQMLLKVIRSEPVTMTQWAVYMLAAFALAAALWYLAVRRYHQERLAVSS